MASQKILNWRPKAVKRETLLIEEAGSEIVVYKLKEHRVHCLNEQAVGIWKLCNGRRTVKQIAGELNIALHPARRELVVGNAIAQFQRLGLVEESHVTPRTISRRDMARKIGIGAAAAVAVPLITSIVAPPAYAATSCPGTSGCSGMNAHCCCNPTCHCVSTCGQSACPNPRVSCI